MSDMCAFVNQLRQTVLTIDVSATLLRVECLATHHLKVQLDDLLRISGHTAIIIGSNSAC